MKMNEVEYGEIIKGKDKEIHTASSWEDCNNPRAYA